MAEANPRRDLSLLWTGQSISLFGDQFMVFCLGLSPQVADAWSRFCANRRA